MLRAIVVSIALLLTPGLLSAQELEAGRTYGANAKVTVKKLGVSLKVPTGWQGAISGEYFVITPNGTDGSQGFLATRAERATLADAKAWLSMPQDLGQGFVFSPEGSPTAKGNTVTVSCTVAQGTTSWPGEASIKVGKHGIALAVISTAPQGSLDRVKKGGQLLLASTSLGKPAIPTPGKPTGKWAKELAGYSLNLYNTTSTTSSKVIITLCPNGQFTRYSGSTGHTETGPMDTAWASHAGYSNRRGKWSTQGAELYLFYEDGTEVSYDVSYNAEGHFLMDGSRWLRVDGDCS